MFWVLKRTVSLRRFFWVPTTYVLVGKSENLCFVKLETTCRRTKGLFWFAVWPIAGWFSSRLWIRKLIRKKCGCSVLMAHPDQDPLFFDKKNGHSCFCWTWVINVHELIILNVIISIYMYERTSQFCQFLLIFSCILFIKLYCSKFDRMIRSLLSSLHAGYM